MHNTCMCIYVHLFIYKIKFLIKNWLMWLWKLRIPWSALCKLEVQKANGIVQRLESKEARWMDVAIWIWMPEDQEAESRRNWHPSSFCQAESDFNCLSPFYSIQVHRGFADAHSHGRDGGHLLYPAHQSRATHPGNTFIDTSRIPGFLWFSQTDT